MAKDRFSSLANAYADFRPKYPEALSRFLASLHPNPHLAWDAGCGNGQLTLALAEHFEHVVGTDISEAQLAKAPHMANITWQVSNASHSALRDHSVQLITVAQAIHWFSFEDFYREVLRVAANQAHIAVIGYNLLRIDDKTDEIIRHLYHDILGGYWDNERKWIDEEYATIPFPFEEITCPSFEMNANWTTEHLFGYLSSWSAVKNYTIRNGANPIDSIRGELTEALAYRPNFDLRFPLLMRVGRLP
jgi:SAM-dependent methyltransferase